MGPQWYLVRLAASVPSIQALLQLHPATLCLHWQSRLKSLFVSAPRRTSWQWPTDMLYASSTLCRSRQVRHQRQQGCPQSSNCAPSGALSDNRARDLGADRWQNRCPGGWGRHWGYHLRSRALPEGAEPQPKGALWAVSPILWHLLGQAQPCCRQHHMQEQTLKTGTKLQLFWASHRSYTA